MFQLPNKKTTVLCQGLTGEEGAAYTEMVLAYGVKIVSGVTHEKGIEKFLGIPVFTDIKKAVKKTKPTVSVIYSTPARALQDTLSAIQMKIPLIVCTTEKVSTQDALKMRQAAHKAHCYLLGPASTGVVSPAVEAVLGRMPAHLFPKGNIGIVSTSNSLLYEVCEQLKKESLGISHAVSLGAGDIIGTDFIPVVRALLSDARTKAILVIGGLNGNMEQQLAEFLKKQKTKKPIFAYIAGRSMNTVNKKPILGMTLQKPRITVSEKQMALKEAKVEIIKSPVKIGQTLAALWERGNK